MKKLSTLSFIALAALALLLVGCGGGGGDDEALTKAEFIKRADSICREVDAREFGEFGAWTKVNEKELETLSSEQVEKKSILTIVVPSIRKEIEEIKALGIPEGDEEELGRFFEEVETGVKATEKDPSSGNRVIEKAPFYGSYKLGRAYGFNDCDEMS